MGEIIKVIPRTENAIRLLGVDNGMAVRSIDEWPPFIDYLYLERELCVLTPVELDTFITGEISDAGQIVELHGLQRVHDFFELLFDSDLTKYFYY